LPPEFWGEHWGGCLAGILRPKPRLFLGPQAREEYRDFEWLADMTACADVLNRLEALDRLLEGISRIYSLADDFLRTPDLTFRPLLFNLWARQKAKLPLDFSGITLAQARALFDQLRGKQARSPYRMPGAGEEFVKAFMAYRPDMDPETSAVLEETLGLIWDEFREEYAWVPTSDVEARYSKFITIEPEGQR
jgi:hypothetical protein